METTPTLSEVIEGNGYETRQSSLLYGRFVLFFALERDKTDKVGYH